MLGHKSYIFFLIDRRQVLPTVPHLLDYVQVEGTFPDGTKLVLSQLSNVEEVNQKQSLLGAIHDHELERLEGAIDVHPVPL
ncbi:urease isoform X2 [Tanacetum coccineum]